LGHLLPNVMPVMIVAASLALGQIILIEAALDFLGLGIQPPTPSWGNMLTNAETYFVHSAWLVVFPGLTIFITVLAANLFGNAVCDALEPRVRCRLMADPWLEVRGLRTQFRRKEGLVEAVDGVDFHVDAGETLGIVGEAGYGKSMTVLSLMRVLPRPGRIVEGRVLY